MLADPVKHFLRHPVRDRLVYEAASSLLSSTFVSEETQAKGLPVLVLERRYDVSRDLVFVAVVGQELLLRHGLLSAAAASSRTLQLID